MSSKHSLMLHAILLCSTPGQYPSARRKYVTNPLPPPPPHINFFLKLASKDIYLGPPEIPMTCKKNSMVKGQFLIFPQKRAGGQTPQDHTLPFVGPTPEEEREEQGEGKKRAIEKWDGEGGKEGIRERGRGWKSRVRKKVLPYNFRPSTHQMGCWDLFWYRSLLGYIEENFMCMIAYG